jgi:hypothetical protein
MVDKYQLQDAYVQREIADFDTPLAHETSLGVIIPHVFVDPSNIEEGSSMGKDYDN